MAPIVAIANLKGGVGKSTTTVMLSEGLAYYYGLNVLVVDLDAQSSSTQMLLTEAGADNSFKSEHGSAHIVKRFLSGKASQIEGMITPYSTVIEELNQAYYEGKKTGWVSLLPSHPMLREIELDLEEVWFQKKLSPSVLATQLSKYLDDALSTVRSHFDIILMDCPPHLSSISRAGLNLADYFVVPTLADVVSFWGLKQFHRYGVKHIEPDMEAKRFIVVTRWSDTTQAKNMYERLTTNLGTSTLGPKISQTVSIQDAMERPHLNSFLKFKKKYQKNARPAVKLLTDKFCSFMQAKESVTWKNVR